MNVEIRTEAAEFLYINRIFFAVSSWSEFFICKFSKIIISLSSTVQNWSKEGEQRNFSSIMNLKNIRVSN